jgi:hypothetical protein
MLKSSAYHRKLYQKLERKKAAEKSTTAVASLIKR